MDSFRIKNRGFEKSYQLMISDNEYGESIEYFVLGLPTEVINVCNNMLAKKDEYDANNVRVSDRSDFVLSDEVIYDNNKYYISLDMVDNSLSISRYKLLNGKEGECINSLILKQTGSHNDIRIFETESVGEFYSELYSAKNVYYLTKNVFNNVGMIRESVIKKRVLDLTKKRKFI